MSALQLYRGPRFELRYAKRLGSQFSAALMVDGVCCVYASPGDFIQLQRWLEAEAAALKAWMAEPEDPRAAENLRGDAPGEA